VRPVGSQLLPAPARPVDQLVAVEAVQLDRDAVPAQRLGERRHGLRVPVRVLGIADEGADLCVIGAHRTGPGQPAWRQCNPWSVDEAAGWSAGILPARRRKAANRRRA